MEIDKYEVVLFNFSDTLVDDSYLKQSAGAPTGYSEAIDSLLYAPYKKDPYGDNLLNQWRRGQTHQGDVANLVAKESGLNETEVLTAMHKGCKNIDFFTKTFNFAKDLKRSKKTGLISLNSDIFSDVIVPHYNLEDSFTTVVNSCFHDTLSKSTLCKAALREMDHTDFSTVLFVDNTERWCEEFKCMGGEAYLYTTDSQFADDFKI